MALAIVVAIMSSKTGRLTGISVEDMARHYMWLRLGVPRRGDRRAYAAKQNKKPHELSYNDDDYRSACIRIANYGQKPMGMTIDQLIYLMSHLPIPPEIRRRGLQGPCGCLSNPHN
jgi:hypothetical protein